MVMPQCECPECGKVFPFEVPELLAKWLEANLPRTDRVPTLMLPCEECAAKLLQLQSERLDVNQS